MGGRFCGGWGSAPTRQRPAPIPTCTLPPPLSAPFPPFRSPSWAPQALLKSSSGAIRTSQLARLSTRRCSRTQCGPQNAASLTTSLSHAPRGQGSAKTSSCLKRSQSLPLKRSTEICRFRGGGKGRLKKAAFHHFTSSRSCFPDVVTTSWSFCFSIQHKRYSNVFVR